MNNNKILKFHPEKTGMDSGFKTPAIACRTIEDVIEPLFVLQDINAQKVRIHDLRKETIERIFGTAKEYSGFRYTQYIGKARMNMKAGLTFACMNLKKLAKIMTIREERKSLNECFLRLLSFMSEKFIRKEKCCWS